MIKINFFATMIFLLLSQKMMSNYLSDENIDKIFQMANKNMPYILQLNEEDQKEALTKDIKTLFSLNPEKENYEELLNDFFSLDLSTFDIFKIDYDNLYKDLHFKIDKIIFKNEQDLLKMDYKATLESIRSLYNEYLLQIMIDNIKMKKVKIDLNTNGVSLLQKYFFNLQNNKEFLKELDQKSYKKKQEIARKKTLLVFLDIQNQFSQDLKSVIKEINDEIKLREFYIMCKFDFYYDLNLKIQVLIYQMTRSRNFNVMELSPYLFKISQLSKLYFSLIKEGEFQVKKNLIFNLSFEKIFVDSFDNEENHLIEIYSHAITNILKEFHNFYPELTRIMMYEILYTEVDINRAEIMVPFFNEIYRNHGRKIWSEWNTLEETKRNNFSLMMTEFLIYQNTEIEEIDQFINNFHYLVINSAKMLQTNYVFKIFTITQCPIKTDFKFNFKLYKSLLDFRFQTFQHLTRENWSSLFDQYLDGRFYYESTEGLDKEFLRYYVNMKIVNFFNLKSETHSSFSELDPQTQLALINNSEQQCLNMNNTIIFLVKKFSSTFTKNVDYEKSIHLLSNLQINPSEFINAYSNLAINQRKKLLLIEKNDVKEFKKNKLNGQVDFINSNIFEVIKGGSLTRKEIDILKRPNILQIFKEKQERDGNLIYNNNDGSETKFLFVQIVPKNTPCFAAFLKKTKKKMVI